LRRLLFVAWRRRCAEAKSCVDIADFVWYYVACLKVSDDAGANCRGVLRQQHVEREGKFDRMQMNSCWKLLAGSTYGAPGVEEAYYGRKKSRFSFVKSPQWRAVTCYRHSVGCQFRPSGVRVSFASYLRLDRYRKNGQCRRGQTAAEAQSTVKSPGVPTQNTYVPDGRRSR